VTGLISVCKEKNTKKQLKTKVSKETKSNGKNREEHKKDRTKNMIKLSKTSEEQE